MANRHNAQCKASGGGVKPKRDGDKKQYDAKGSNVGKEAHEMKRGGKAHGKKAGERLDKRARGGGVKGSGKDMTKSPFSAAALSGANGPASNPSPGHLTKGTK